MAKVTEQQVGAEDYGNQTQEAQDVEGLAATAAMEAETTPTLQPPEAAAPAQQSAPQQAQSPTTTPQQQGFVPTNLMQRVPHNFSARPANTLADSVNAAAQMWGALAIDPNASAGLRSFARWMMED